MEKERVNKTTRKQKRHYGLDALEKQNREIEYNWYTGYRATTVTTVLAHGELHHNN